MCVCVCVYLNLSTVPLKVMQHCKSAVLQLKLKSWENIDTYKNKVYGKNVKPQLLLMGSVQWKCDTGFSGLFSCHPQDQQRPGKAVGRGCNRWKRGAPNKEMSFMAISTAAEL